MIGTLNYFAKAIKYSSTIINTFVLSQLHPKTLGVRQLLE